MSKLVTRIIRITEKQDKALKSAKRSENFKLSPWVRDQLDKKLFGDPDFIEEQIKNNELLINEITEMNKKLKQEKLQIIERITQRKERLEATKTPIRRYGELELKDSKKHKKTGGKHGSSS